MRREALVCIICLAISGPSVWVSLDAQSSNSRPDSPGSALKNGALPRTADGRPDLQGTWVNFDSTPLEASSSEDAIRLKALAGWFPGIDAPGETRQIRGPNPAPEFVDIGVKRSPRRRSMVVDPPNGRVPLRKEAEEQRSTNLARLTDAWEYHTPWERCITRGVPGGMFPAGYNNGYVILQTSDYVVILYEMIHEARIIPLDGRPHIGTNIGLWNGDSRGRWEGDSLVVEITNYRAEPVGAVATGISTTATLKGVPQTRAMRVVERFTRTDLDTVRYEVTIEDPGVYTSAWKVAMPLNRAGDYRVFEYACHEGNYGLPNSLSGARADERALHGSTPK